MADSNYQDRSGRTALHNFLFHNYKLDNPDYIEFLLKSGANPNLKDNLGQTPLYLAARHKSKIFQYLLDFGADLNARDNRGRAPLHYASHFRDGQSVLIQAGADVNIQDNSGRASLHAAKICMPHIKRMLQAGANIHSKDNSGMSPLAIALRFRRNHVTSVLLAQ